MNPYLPFIESIEKGIEQARTIQVHGSVPTPASESKVLLFSPHPDDECIYGTLPYRLMHEEGMEIINIPVTYGSNKERKAGRSKELQDACAFLGWKISRAKDTLDAMEVDEAVALLHSFKPRIIFMPHVEDWNSRHISTHHLIMEALRGMDPAFTCTVVETEFWGAMDDPNLMVEADTRTVADLVAALSLHVGEVARNPYHLLCPAWMQDNVRRGGELVGGQGGAAPSFSFATLYRLSRWANGDLKRIENHNCIIPAGAEALRKSYSWKS